MLFLNSLNWTLEVYILLISEIFVLVSFILISHEFRKTKNFFFLNLLMELQNLGTAPAMDILEYAKALESV